MAFHSSFSNILLYFIVKHFGSYIWSPLEKTKCTPVYCIRVLIRKLISLLPVVSSRKFLCQLNSVLFGKQHERVHWSLWLKFPVTGELRRRSFTRWFRCVFWAHFLVQSLLQLYYSENWITVCYKQDKVSVILKQW